MEGYAPFIRTFAGNLSRETCREIVATFEKDKANQVPGRTLHGALPDVKRTTDLLISKNGLWQDIDAAVFDKLRGAIEEYVSVIPHEHDLKDILTSTLRDRGYLIHKYDKLDGFYHWHNDFLVLSNGQWRVLTFLWYLNDVEEGGETEFIDGTTIKPEAGKLLIFPATWSLKHRARRPLSGDKYVMTGWLYSGFDAPHPESVL